MRTLDMWWKFQMRTQKPAIVVTNKTKATKELRSPAQSTQKGNDHAL
jgi:hypothetical protein